jgi:hypothetical protein
MTIENRESATLASRTYAALRQGGAPAWKARTQLGLPAALAARCERIFRGGAGAGRPRFARHELHVAAAMAEGGFPALPERRR